MALTKKDLQAIKGIVIDVVDDKIEDLATTIQKEFIDQNERLDKRFDEVDKRFDEVDKRFDEVDNKINTEIGLLRSEMHSGFNEVDKRFDRLEGKVDRINKRTIDDEDAMAGDILNLQKRTTKLEKLKAA